MHDLISMAERDDELGDSRVAEDVDSDVAFDDELVQLLQDVVFGIG